MNTSAEGKYLHFAAGKRKGKRKKSFTMVWSCLSQVVVKIGRELPRNLPKGSHGGTCVHERPHGGQRCYSEALGILCFPAVGDRAIGLVTTGMSGSGVFTSGMENLNGERTLFTICTIGGWGSQVAAFLVRTVRGRVPSWPSMDLCTLGCYWSTASPMLADGTCCQVPGWHGGVACIL